MSRSALHGDFPPAPLREYALLADGERGALCGPHGEIVWLCAPRWHDDAVFASLIGSGAGAYSVTPRARSVWGGFYEAGTLIWENRWATDERTLVCCRDALALPTRPESLVLLRRVYAAQGDARVRIQLDPRAGFGKERLRDTRRDDNGVWTARVGDLTLRWTGGERAALTEEGLVFDMDVRHGHYHDLVLEIGAGGLPGGPPQADDVWQRTADTWRAEVPRFESSAAPRDTRHAYAVMRGLTSRSGGMVAAATTSLPEQADADRNYDYRYVWIRDQCFAGLAVASDGEHPLLPSAVEFVTARVLADGAQLVPAYLVDGGSVPEERHLDLSGYPGGVGTVGNHVTEQFQLDALGEVLTLLSVAAERGCLDGDGRRAAQLAVQGIEKRWQEAESGIWELDAQWWTQSRLACVAGLRNWAPHGLPGSRLDELAEAILAETTSRCLHRSGRWQRSDRDDRVDAALLVPPLRGALSTHDRRTVATLDAVRQTLVDDWYVYRYHPRSGHLGADEGAFLLCGFLLSLAELDAGNVADAYRAFERNRAACGPPGLLAEEFDVAERQLRGNLPQAFVHAVLLEASVRLGAM